MPPGVSTASFGTTRSPVRGLYRLMVATTRVLRRPRTLARKAFWATLLIALLALGNVLVMQLLLRQSDNIAATLSLAGRMRMLSQQMTLRALAPRQDALGMSAQLQEQYADFESAHAALLHGGHTHGQPVQALAPGLQPSLQSLTEGWRQYRQALERLPSPPLQTPEQIREVMAAGDLLLVRTERLMEQLVQYADGVHQRARVSSLALFVLDMLLLALAYTLLVRRVLRPVRALTTQCRDMAMGRYGTHTPLPMDDELGELAQALHRSSAQIATLLHDVARERDALAQMQAMFDGLTDNSVAGVYLLDESMHLVYANEQLARMLGYERQLLADRFPLARLFSPAVFDDVRVRVQDRLQGRLHSARYERTALRADGSSLEIEIFGTAMRLNGRPAVIGMMLDISQRKRAEASARRAALVYQNTTEAMVVTDAQGVVLDTNPAFTQVTGYAAHEIVGRRMNMLSSGRQSRAFYQAMWASLLESGKWSGDIWNRRKNGDDFVERLTISASYNEDGSVGCYIGLFADVTAQRRQEASIWHQAHHDHLTQLPNRQMFQQELERSMAQTRASGQSFALLFLDLDMFKEVNDTFGHDMGDELLCEVAHRLRGCVRASDKLARLGGDEFTLILHHLQQPQDAHAVCRKVLHALAQPYELMGGVVQISASAGITYFPRDGQDGVALLKQADLAMYAAKNKGRNQFCEFVPAMEQEAQERRLLLRDLQQALDGGELTLHYQPIVDMHTGRTVKAEALLRWHHGVRGPVSPAQFVPLAEESGLIVPLGDWVFQEAARQLARWRAEIAPELEINVNVSPVQLQSSGPLAQPWLRHLQTLRLPPEALAIELTENVLMEADQDTSARLQALQSAGMQLALDDFGTGYSSLAYLKRLDIDYLKIDRSFVSQLTQGSEDNVLCQAIIVMAHQLGIRVVAEGVETREQHDILRAAGCDFGQGYWYCHPVSAEDFGARLHEERAAVAEPQQPSPRPSVLAEALSA